MTQVFRSVRVRAALRVVFVTLSVGLGFFLLSLPARARPSTVTYTVNSLVDEPNSTLGSTTCSSTPSGVCTLRAAIMAANANPGADVVNIPGGTFHLTIGGTNEFAQAGDLDITDDLNVTGAGAGTTIIDGSQLAPSDRLFDVRPGAHVTMSGLTIQYGNTTDRGGAIRIGDPSVQGGDAALTISNCSILNNHSATNQGGGFYNSTAGSSLTISNCSIGGNAADFGGGILNNGTLSISTSNIYSNTASTEGGGIYNQGGSAAIDGTTFSTNSSFNGGGIANVALVTIVNGAFNQNQGGFGGGVLNDGTLVDSNTVFDGNKAINSNGGGLANRGNASLTGVTFTSNMATYYGAGISTQGTLTLTRGMLNLNSIAVDGGGGLAQLDGTAVIANSAIVSNTAAFGGGVLLLASAGGVTLTNSTVSGNTTSGVGAGVYNHQTGTANLANDTIAYNGNGLLQISGAGGVDTDGGGTTNFKNTLIAWNYYQGISFPVYISDCSGSLASGGYNLVRVDCGFAHQTGDQVGTFSFPLDPKIGSLLNNGGATPTHALLSGSPAIDAGNVGGCRDVLGALLNTDQRGFPRPWPSGGRCDIGAYEYGFFNTYLPLIGK